MNKLGIIETIKGENGITHTLRNTSQDVLADKINEIVDWVNARDLAQENE